MTSPPDAAVSEGDTALRRVTHRTVHEVAQLLDGHRFNVAVARIMELVNAARKAVDAGPGGADPAVREAVEAVAKMLSVVAPYTAEEIWAALGHPPSVAVTSWPVVDPLLLVQEAVTCVVQVQGKVRARLSVPPGIADDDLERLALDDLQVQRAVDGRPVRRIIVRAPSLVNVVV